MKQTLQLRLGQHLTMTPQLQQAIRLLQLSTLELQTEIQDALDSNLMLEMDEEGDSTENNEPTDSYTVAEAPPGAENQETPQNVAESDETESAASETPGEIPDDLPVDSNWDDIYDNVATAQASSPAEPGPDFEISGSTDETLQDYLRWQMELSHFSDTDRAIAEVIIDSINDDGYLGCSIEEVQQALGDEEIELDEIEAVLHRVQHFDPPGVGARDLRESLTLQLKQFPLEHAHLQKAMELVDQHFELLAHRDYAQLQRKLKLDEAELRDVVQLITSLNPRPGGRINTGQPEYIIPDVIVNKVKGQWRVELNPDAAPRLRINPHYASLIKKVKNDEDNATLKNHLQEARWFLKSLTSRNETLLKVATSIVERQKDFLEHGEEAMKALVLHDIAEEVDMHESTISRVTTKKYMHTPRGIYELKYFFSSHVSTSSGGEASATAIRALIKKLVAAESPNKPLSDSKIATILSDKGINVARRTVAKYREAMAIPPSNERKRLA
ncbi:RNA polymerase factor sigma-54 [Thiohalophilus sp.]|uniref:RNA polymerase factor sigma-54 n=1 Tax=Thiohalophilus sp. TaxID=3028392 RepID=UPI002ACDB459|nr:RNA polymerase factor sigma-54 [Thiohalophilus sp.]MDZ7662252.1 RNA polymerase factor sigma-54 [Thiohalophilus sp.]